ncbi:MAG: hypothetical protein ACFFCV_12545 [Promethearchaeota archaeon]
MKKRLKKKCTIIILIITSFLSIFWYIALTQIDDFEENDTDSGIENLPFKDTFFLGTSNEIYCTFFIENGPEINKNCTLENFFGKNHEPLFIFFIGTNVSIDFIIILKNLLKYKVLDKNESQELEEVFLNDVETRIFELVQDFLSTNRVFNKENVVMYIKSRFKTNGNLNYIGINAVIDSLIKKNVVKEGSKLTIKTLLINKNRLRIFNLIKENPGIYRNKLVEEINSSPFVVNWHLSILKKFQLIRENKIDGHLGYFEFSMSKSNDKIYHTILKDKCMRILEYLNSEPHGVTKYRIAKSLSMHYNTVSKYLNKLEEFDLLSKKEDGKTMLLFLDSSNFKKIINNKQT